MAVRPIFEDASAAVADVFDSATILLGGFSAALGAPQQLFVALMGTTARDLTFVGNGTPQVVLSNPGEERRFTSFDVDRVRKVICSFPAPASARRGAFGSHFADAFEEGKVELELVPQGTLAERLRAGGAGIPAFFTPTGVGTRFEESKEVREFEGKRYVMERWLRADFALVRAQKADRLGNLIYRNTARNFNPIMAMAARVTIAEVDEIVEPGELRPEEIVTPGIFVDRLYVRRQD